MDKYTSIKNNSNFKSVKLYHGNDNIVDLIKNTTKHLSKDRIERAKLALKLNNSSPVHRVFIDF